MSKNQGLERGIIPAGTRIKLYEGRVTLLEDVVVDANQEWINKAIQDEKDFYNGVGVVCYGACTPKKLDNDFSESLSESGREQFAENNVISCKNSIN